MRLPIQSPLFKRFLSITVFSFFTFFSSNTSAQYATTAFTQSEDNSFSYDGRSFTPVPFRKLYQRNYGMIIGLQRGRSTFIEFGGEAHWRKYSLKNPTIIGANANMEYNFGHHVIGYKAGMWMKQGRVNFTYGGNMGYYTNFKNSSKFAIGPAIGFRLLGFHLINGYNILIGDKELNTVNTLYITLRYYFPIDNKFTWDRQTRLKKARAQKAREKKKADRKKRNNEGDKKWYDIFHRNDND